MQNSLPPLRGPESPAELAADPKRGSKPKLGQAAAQPGKRDVQQGQDGPFSTSGASRSLATEGDKRPQRASPRLQEATQVRAAKQASQSNAPLLRVDCQKGRQGGDCPFAGTKQAAGTKAKAGPAAARALPSKPAKDASGKSCEGQIGDDIVLDDEVDLNPKNAVPTRHGSGRSSSSKGQGLKDIDIDWQQSGSRGSQPAAMTRDAKGKQQQARGE